MLGIYQLLRRGVSSGVAYKMTAYGLHTMKEVAEVRPSVWAVTGGLISGPQVGCSRYSMYQSSACPDGYYPESG